ncbi:MAG: hypothetical protein DA330_04950 [Nitrososphaera sp.]|nr:hypothetical protein [Nitrososphaera sp.]
MSESDQKKFLAELSLASEIMRLQRQTGKIAGGFVSGEMIEIKEFEELALVGDIHGDMQTLCTILNEIRHEKFLANPANKLVFLGDYVDRGSDSIDVLSAICGLKRQHRDSVILMRGNHEAPSEFPFSSHDLPYRVQDRFKDAKIVYRKILGLFREMSLAVKIRKDLFLVHGGLPTDLASVSNFPASIAAAQENHIRDRVMEELLWNDPRQHVGKEGWSPSSRGIGRYFGHQITQRWLAATNTRIVVRGHEPCQGFRIDDDSILTLFSSQEPYPAFSAGYILISSAELGSVSDAKDLSKHVRIL